MSDKPFMECLDAFAAHEYQLAANLGVNLLEQRRYHWLYQVILISLQRVGNRQAMEAMGKIALDAFAEHWWETQLLRLTIEDLEIDNISDLDLRGKCQLCFYLACSFLTRGGRAAARPLFEVAALTRAQCAEAVLAASEVSRPEARTITLDRVLSNCQHAFEGIASVQEAGDAVATFLRQATTAVEIIEDLPQTPESPDELQELQKLALVLGGWLHEEMSHEEARNIYDRLSRAPLAPGQAPAVPRRLPAGIPPLRPVKVTLKQLAIDGSSELESAAIAFGFPLFLGRHPLTASPERPVHQMVRETNKDGVEVGPFCRRRFSGDSSIPLPRSRYYALCSPLTNDDGGTVAAEMMAYTLPTLTGYCAARQGAGGVEVVFRGLPQEPNPFYLACRNPDGVEHVFRGSPSGNPLHTLTTLPSADNVLIMPIATNITEQRFERCLDMRMHDAREWLTRLFANPPDGSHGDSLRVLANVHRFELCTVSKWLDLLPVLIARTSGGNTLTDMVGAYLRSLGCDALVFPSARSDFFATFCKDTLVSASGWNLVDYRGLNPVGRVGVDIGDPIEPLVGQIDVAEYDEGDTKGSIWLLGNERTTCLINQNNYEYFLFAHGSRWVVEHKERAMLVRSYLWYRKRYPRWGGFLCICDQCENSFNDESVAVRRVCPICGFQGDLGPSETRG